MHLEYLKRRKELVNTIESFSILQSSDQETFFQAVFYLDKIIFEEKFSQILEKITGKANEIFVDNDNIEDKNKNRINNEEVNFFARFIKGNNLEFNRNELYSASETTNETNFPYLRNVMNHVEFDYLFISLAIACFNISSKL